MKSFTFLPFYCACPFCCPFLSQILLCSAYRAINPLKTLCPRLWYRMSLVWFLSELGCASSVLKHWNSFSSIIRQNVSARWYCQITAAVPEHSQPPVRAGSLCRQWHRTQQNLAFSRTRQVWALPGSSPGGKGRGGAEGEGQREGEEIFWTILLANGNKCLSSQSSEPESERPQVWAWTRQVSNKLSPVKKEKKF